MPLIKRYPNRKLYDTESKRYITLEGIAGLIRRGCEIQVLDHATGDDLTAVTLTQVIFEQEKKQASFLPHSILAGLIQTSGNRLSTLQRNLVSQFGLLPFVDEEIQRRLQILVRLGELGESEANHIIEKLLDLEAGIYTDRKIPSEEAIEQVLNKRGIPTRADLDRLLAQLDTLTVELEKLTAQK